MRENWVKRLGRGVVLLASGSMVLGSSCVEDVRDSMVSGGLDFVEASTVSILESWFTLDRFTDSE